LKLAQHRGCSAEEMGDLAPRLVAAALEMERADGHKAGAERENVLGEGINHM
jgi:hypothetical protein